MLAILLDGLSRPYAYDAARLYYDWATRCWRLLPSRAPVLEAWTRSRHKPRMAGASLQERLRRMWKLEFRSMDIIPCDPPQPEVEPKPREPDALKAVLDLLRARQKG